MKHKTNKIICPFIMLLMAQLSLADEPWSTTFHLLNMEAGDVACYVDLTDNKGNRQQVMASFEICDKRHLIGQDVTGYFEQATVLAASCNGDIDCGRSDAEVLMTAIKATVKEAVRTPQTPTLSHCFANELIIFSCNTHSNKIISICAAKNINQAQGYMQYRFGSAGYFPEYVYPSNHDLAKKFFYSGNLIYSRGGGSYLKFVNGSYSYVVYTGIGHGWEKQGLVVSDGDNEISRYACKDSWVSEMGPDLFSQTGLATDPVGFGIPVDYNE